MTAEFHDEKALFGDARILIDKQTYDHGLLDAANIPNIVRSVRNVLYKPTTRRRLIKFNGSAPTVIYSTVFFADELAGRIAHLKYVVKEETISANNYIESVRKANNIANSNIPTNGSLEDDEALLSNKEYYDSEVKKHLKKLEILEIYKDKIKALQKEYYEK